MSVPSDMNRFSMNPTNLDISRSVFNRNHSVKFSGNVGDVIPFYLDEVLPGDTFSIDTSKVVRTQPLVTPIMDEVVLDTYYFFVPNRLIWNHWKEFMGENNESPWTPETTYSIPQVEIPTGGYNVGTIADYMGVPIGVGAGKKISALPFRAYALICDEWFRDQNNMSPVNVNKDDTDITGSNGSDQVTDIVKGGSPFIACKLHDYFTSCLPGTQKGPQVSLPGFDFSGTYPVYPLKDKSIFNLGDTLPSDFSLSGERYNAIDYNHKVTKYDSAYGTQYLGNIQNDQDKYNVITASGFGAPYNTPKDASLFCNNLFSVIDFEQAGVTVNELRQAFAVQKYYEKLARGGSRYIEMVKAFFNVTSPDSRIQRSEYLGGNRVPLNVSQVEQTSATESTIDTPQGNVVGMSLTGDVNSDFTKSFTEHGYIIGVAVARYHHTYQDGLERHWFRKTNFDYYNPVFANLGEQAVYSHEIYLDVVDDDDVFGYQEAWADYRYKPSRVAGEMRSAYATPLDMWHLADSYDSCPQLGDSWIREDKSNLDRCLAVTSSVSNQLIFDFYVQGKVARPMPLYSIPGLIDHH